MGFRGNLLSGFHRNFIFDYSHFRFTFGDGNYCVFLENSWKKPQKKRSCEYYYFHFTRLGIWIHEGRSEFDNIREGRRKMAMMISLEPLRQHLIKESKNGSPTAILFAQLALFVTFLFLHKTTFISKHDAEGIKSVLSYQIIALLLPYSKHLSQRKILPQSCGGLEVNLFMNSGFLLLVVPLENFFEKSKGSLGAVLSAAVLVIVLRVIIRPQSDFGVLSFLLGAAVSIACNLYRVGYQTWVVVAICIGLLSIRFLVVQNWFQVEDDDENQESPPHPISTIFSQENNNISKSSEIIEAIFVSGFYIYWDQDLLRRTNCPGGSVIIFCIPPSLKKSVVPSVVVLALCSSLAIALRLYTLLITVKIKKKVREISMEQEIEIVCFQGGPGGSRIGLFSVMKDALRKRYSKQSKAVASFQKVLTKTSINSMLTWVVVAICIGLVGFRFLLVQNWLEVEDEGSAAAPIIISSRSRTAQENKRISKSTIIQAFIVPAFYLYWDLDLLRSNCTSALSINSCSKTCLKGLAACLVILVLWFSLTAIALLLYPLLISSLVSSSNNVRIEINSDTNLDEEKVEADDRRRKGKIEEKVEVGKQKGALQSRRRRHNNQSKVTASFGKILTDTDANQRLG